jgi:hypothetical protein
MNEEEKKAYR